ncbi:MAG: GNAT family N-acetyltransferase [Phycisphaerales bacterium]|nr:GNAT family N-acetyltransferase [Phycisphaerales bacterium]
MRPFNAGDAADVQRLAGDERVGRPELDIPHPYPDGGAETWIATHDQMAAENKERIWAVTQASSGDLIGCISLNRSGGDHCAEMGYWLGAPFWGHGYMAEAGCSLIDWAFLNTKIIRVQAMHSTDNPASGRVMQKIGMRQEAVMRHNLHVNDQPIDSVHYAVIKEHWPPSSDVDPTESLCLEQLPRSTGRLWLRPATMSDVEAMHHLFCSPGVYEGLASIPKDPDLQFANDRVQGMCDAIQIGNRLNLLACLGDPQGPVIGEIGIGIRWRHRMGGLGYLLDADYRGRGYATEMLRGMAGHAFGPMGLNRLHAATYPGNKASCQLLDRHGFTQEGLSRGAYCKEGQYLDALEWGLLATDPRPWAIDEH